MNHCTHEQSQALKEIGFDEPTDYVYGYDGTLVRLNIGNYINMKMDVSTSAPTHAEALDWFREKKGIDGWVRPYPKGNNLKYYIYEMYQHRSKTKSYPTHHEATSALIDKMIETTKRQNNNGKRIIRRVY
jgi:hypothetical protein